MRLQLCGHTTPLLLEQVKQQWEQAGVDGEGGNLVGSRSVGGSRVAGAGGSSGNDAYIVSYPIRSFLPFSYLWTCAN